jgi:hypothetical protein
MKIFDPRFYGELTPSNFLSSGGVIWISIEVSAISKNSFPIEIGWYSKTSEGSMLIKPSEDWLSDGNWSNYAEKHCHGISKQLLSKKGVDIKTAAIKLNEIFQNNVVVSDSVQCEAKWLTKLFGKAKVSPSFTLIGSLELRDFRIKVGILPLKSLEEVLSERSKKK